MKDEGELSSTAFFILHPSDFILAFGAEGEIRTLEASLEDSHVSSYITPARDMELLAGFEPATSTFEASHSSN